jgi:ATP-binding cassette subfamily B protein RaxB
MVADHHGHCVGLRDLRQQFPLSLKGAKLSGLIDISRRLGFDTRAVRVELEDMSKLVAPCILHWNLDHFVVLESATRGGITIHDPAMGRRRLTLKEASSSFTGVALELTPNHDFKQRERAPAIGLRRLTGRVRGLVAGLAQLIVLSLALQVFVLLAPFYMQWVVDQAIVSADYDLLSVLGIAFSASLLFQVLIGWLRGWAVVYLSSTLGLQWNKNVFSHLLKLKLEFFERRNLGDITSRMGSVNTIQQTLSNSFVEVVIDGVMAVATFGLMFLYSWKLALITLLAVIAYALLRAFGYQAVRNRTEKQLIAQAKQQSHLLESLRGMQSLKIAGKENVRRSIYSNLMTDSVNQGVWLSRAGLWFTASNQMIFGIERIAVIWVGALLALTNVFSVGMLIAYLAYKDQFALRIGALIDRLVEFKMLRLHGERLADIVLTEPEDQTQLHSLEADRSPIDIEVHGVYYRYAEGDPWVLENCSFTIDAGESVAIVGASGCGKTTLLKLILGVMQPTKGYIRVGGIDLTKKGLGALRPNIGAVMQDDQLFAGTIADNISFFESDVDMEKVYAASRLACIHDDILAMPMGYRSLIGDMGSSLSGGQKQRVVLARALYNNPLLLCLDEATSHLDVKRERDVSEAIKRLSLTKVMIAHRPETVASADRVLAMEGGRVVRSFKPVQGGALSTDLEHILREPQ